jgi:hypothetical protein
VGLVNEAASVCLVWWHGRQIGEIETSAPSLAADIAARQGVGSKGLEPLAADATKPLCQKHCHG